MCVIRRSTVVGLGADDRDHRVGAGDVELRSGRRACPRTGRGARRRTEHERTARRDLVPDDAVALDRRAGGPKLELRQVRDVGDADGRERAPPRPGSRRARASRRAPRRWRRGRAARARSQIRRPGGSRRGRRRRRPRGTRAPLTTSPSRRPGRRTAPRCTVIGVGPPVHLHVEPAAVDRELVRDDREPDHLAELGAAAHARHAARRDCRRSRPGRPRPGSRRVGLSKPTSIHFRPRSATCCVAHLPTQSNSLSFFTSHGIAASCRFDSESVSWLDDHVALLEPQDALRLEPERLRVEVGGLLEDRVPDVLGERAREVELVAELADEADPERERRDARRP